MSLTADSPVHSSSSDDFAAIIDAELDAISSGASQEQEEDDDDTEAERIKRRKVDELDTGESQEATSLSAMQQESDEVAKVETCPAGNVDEVANVETCPHPAFFREMCVTCGQYMNDDSAVAFGYVHKDLKIGTEEMDRLRGSNLKNVLRNRKLHLVLDLDHTLLNSTRVIDVSPEEEYLINHTDSLQDIPNGSLFKVDSIHMLTKLRPFVRTFLKEASSMYEMYIYTMGERPYALEMAQLLDPGRVYFNSRVISQADCTQKHQKGLDVVLGADSAVVILDDTEIVWNRHRENLILMERYHFFASSSRPFGLSGKSLSELKRDESEKDGALATVLTVLKRIHEMFFNLELEANLTSGDVRKVLKTVRSEVLKGCKIVFSRVWKVGERAENQKLWEIAQLLGAECSTELNQSVTHVVSTDTGTEKARWAVQQKKFLVHPRWIEAANYMWKRQPEEQFSINHIKNQ